ncbi:hypothetical protein [Mucisphaera calidilacus]|uniref:Glycosyltransferase RgtA/B/C/D-like domain-containing protein n=1 Tax=Mucisphaera calidilacus TaxID=2527982 RepID=A0A518BUC1_9BACT|nr:hypothetical protein [Mucisphaera calidilacus]QDU70578.1 hypothetical protein Pan265_04060 [Mucisphaera calidilacus]
MSRQLENRLRQAGNSLKPWIIALAAFILLTHTQWWWNGTGDEMNYLSIARHLAAGEVARYDQPALRYAPGYPLLIAPAFWIAERPFLIINLIHAALLIVALYPMHQWFRRHARHAAPLLTAFVVVNLSLWYYTRRPLSEAAFIPLLFLTALALQNLAESPSIRRDIIKTIATATLITLLVAVRQLGVFLLPAFAIVLIARIRYHRLNPLDALARLAIVATPACLAILAISRYDQIHSPPDEQTYVEHLVHSELSITQRLLLGLHLRVSEIGRLIMPGMRTTYAQEGNWLDINMLIYGSLAIALAWGWLRLVRSRADTLLCFLPFYLAFLLVWPYEAATRYAVPILIPLALTLSSCLRTLPRHLTTLAALTILHAIVTLAFWGIEATRADTAQQWDAAQHAARVIRDNPGNTIAHRLETPWVYRLRFLLNRNVLEVPRLDTRTLDSNHWIATTPQHAPPPESWEPIPIDDTVTLYQRRNDTRPSDASLLLQ